MLRRKRRIYACINSRIATDIQLARDWRVVYCWYNEPFAVSLCIVHLYLDMHGLIFETSVWQLAGSTRLCNAMFSSRGHSPRCLHFKTSCVFSSIFPTFFARPYETVHDARSRHDTLHIQPPCAGFRRNRQQSNTKTQTKRFCIAKQYNNYFFSQSNDHIILQNAVNNRLQKQPHRPQHPRLHHHRITSRSSTNTTRTESFHERQNTPGNTKYFSSKTKNPVYFLASRSENHKNSKTPQRCSIHSQSKPLKTILQSFSCTRISQQLIFLETIQSLRRTPKTRHPGLFFRLEVRKPQKLENSPTLFHTLTVETAEKKFSRVFPALEFPNNWFRVHSQIAWIMSLLSPFSALSSQPLLIVCKMPHFSMPSAFRLATRTSKSFSTKQTSTNSKQYDGQTAQNNVI